MIQFRKHLQEGLTSILTNTVGPGTDPTNFVKTFDERLKDTDIANLPQIVVNVRTAEKAAMGGSGDAEIGTPYDLYMWTVHIYYLDIETSDWAAGDDRRDFIIGNIEKALEENRRLGNLEIVDVSEHREYVYDSSISAILFDDSGQEDYHSFVTELYLNVYTARN